MLLIFGGLQAQAAPCGSGESSSSRVPQTGQQALPELWARSLRVKDGWQRGGRRQCQTRITYEGDVESCAALSGMVKGVDKAARFRGGGLLRVRGGGAEDWDGDYEAERAAKLRKNQVCRAFAVKVIPKRLPVFLFSGLLKDFKGHKTHRFENGGTDQIRKTGKRDVVLGQPLPQTL